MSKRGNNEGSIYKRADGRWAAAVTIPQTGGKQTRKTLYGRTRQEVQQKLTKALRDQQQGIPATNDRITLKAFLARWLETCVKPPMRRPLTYTTYKTIIDLHVVPELGRIPLSKLKPGDVQDLLNKKSAAGLSNRRVEMIHAVLRTALNQAVSWGELPRNVAALAKPPRTSRRDLKPFTPEEAQAFLIAAKGDRLEALYTVAVAIGLRQGEILGLRWEDVDLENSTLTVRHALQRVDGELILVEPKSDSGRRAINLPAFAVRALKEHHTRQKQEARWGGLKWHETGHVFTTKVGTPMHHSGLIRQFKKLLKEAKLRDQRFHDLRHCCATLLLAQGVPARVVMEILGHSQISLTLDTYSHVIPALRDEAAGRMDALFGGAQ